MTAASRLAESGGLAGLNRFRRNVSRGLIGLTQLVFPGHLTGLSDPLTGFFLVRKSAIDPAKLYLNGFKILLDILLSTEKLRVSEVPFQIQSRHSGRSKIGLREMLRFFMLVVQLRLRDTHQLRLFLSVGLTGIVVNSALLYVLTVFVQLHYLLSALLATQGSTLWNFILIEWWVFGRESNRFAAGWRLFGFFAINNIFLILRGPILFIMVTWTGIYYVLSNLVTIGIMTVIRYLASRHIIWSKGEGMEEKDRFYYDIHQLVRLVSQAPLPELRFFKVPALDVPADIRVEVGSDKSLPPSEGEIVYDENLGDMGFWIRISRETATRVLVSPILARSPHVLYTNVVEPLLRWKLVEKGYALVHGASVAHGMKAVMVTARTDTGKTTTILRTLSRKPYSFLSDDMTILGKDGWLYSFPKPLTNSWHTLRAVDTAQLSRRERVFLWFQSNLHSRLGRQVGLFFGSLKLPAATLNALVQILIPPPKFPIDRLVPKREPLDKARLSQILVIERGGARIRPLNNQQILKTLMANSDDAYGFPPYPVISGALRQHGDIDLGLREQEIVNQALKGIPGVRILEPDYGWYRWLPGFLEGPPADLFANHTRSKDPHAITENAAPVL